MNKPATCSDSSKNKGELAAIEKEITEIRDKMVALKRRSLVLKKRKEILMDEQAASNEFEDENDWNGTHYPWSVELMKKCEDVFQIKEFRQFQLAAINATLSKKDLILIMPTGGGKSLCYQLPAIIDKGFTLVVSPMISLMEDQISHLKKMGIHSEMLCGVTKSSESNLTYQAMVNPETKLKLLYVTPEKVAKSKIFMNKLQKAYDLKLLSRVAIDEVHCCSEWGHDFRQDYTFLYILKSMFPDVPLIGLTATATAKVLVDVQKMLALQGCIVLKASFNRLNLFFKVCEKPDNQEDCLAYLETLLKNKYKNQSGIIYTATVSECEELHDNLRKRNLRVHGYHAQVDPSLRTKIHHKWLEGTYQAVVATIAFGLGIDKPDVRFVIHFTMSKSIENLYQESGRAGRDGENADCILMYKFPDVFRLSSMVVRQQVGVANLHAVLKYCTNNSECRRKILAGYFGEDWKPQDCKEMCDICSEKRVIREVDATKLAKEIFNILNQAEENEVKLTASMLVDVLSGKTVKKLKIRVSEYRGREFIHLVLAHMLIHGYLKEDFHFTAYSTICYLKRGRIAIPTVVTVNVWNRSKRIEEMDSKHNFKVKIPKN